MHQMLRYLRYRHADALRAMASVGDVDEATRIIDELFKAMKQDVEVMW